MLTRPWSTNLPNIIGHYWTTLPALPTPVIEDWYLTDNNRLQREQTNSYPLGVGSYYTNPARVERGANLFLECGMLDTYGDYYPSFPIIHVVSPMFTEPYAIAGHVKMTVYASNTYSDIDVFVALYDDTDTLADHHVASGITRLQWRNGFVPRQYIARSFNMCVPLAKRRQSH